MRALFVIPTTGGPVVIRRILRRDLPLSLVVADGDYRPLPVSEDYSRLVAADGPVAGVLGREAAGCFELRLDRAFESGRSWEFPVALAHAAHAAGWDLVDDPAQAERLVIATGALDRDLRLVPADYSLTLKAERMTDLVRAALGAGARVAAFIPGGDPGVELAQSRLRALLGTGDHLTPIVVTLGEALAALRLAPDPVSKTVAKRPAAIEPESKAVKRKIAAIVAADVYGYSRMMAEDEEGTLRRLNACRQVFDEFVSRSGGRIFNTAGDSVMCEFESAVEAVRCAVDIQEALRSRGSDIEASKRLLFRIGISIGDVVERNGDLLGDGVNVAARLESIAEPGGIVVSRSVHEAVSNKVSVMFQDLGAREVKNLAPVHAFAIASPAARVAAAEEAARTALAASKIAAPPPAPAPASPPKLARALPVPAMAAGVALLVAAGAGGWFMLAKPGASPAAPPAAVVAAAPPTAPRTEAPPAAPVQAAPVQAAVPAMPLPSPPAPAPVALPAAPPAAMMAAVPSPGAVPPPPPVAETPIAIEELRAAPGRACADLVFGGVQPARMPVALREDGSPVSSHPSGLCGLAIRVTPGGERVGFRLDPALVAAGIVSGTQPGPAAGELSVATVMFRQTGKLPPRHAIELVDHRVSPPATRRLVHDIGAGATAAPGLNRLAQPIGLPVR
ncbi:adenylate/guanylate cyclase domain-containing protein [Salinarimonas soli]|uniref:adenylate/guanylate cyclase domain-containing protein n=1 Tax=Salinarimonas soli TaxID=1638099 RepID=UPI001F0B33F0|nr:adenylate/guanylate cyclase domain-containing protein [Salinarimonas soli]